MSVRIVAGGRAHTGALGAHSHTLPAVAHRRAPPRMQRTQGRARNARIEVFLGDYTSTLGGPQRLEVLGGAACVQSTAAISGLDFEEAPGGSYAVVECGALRLELLMDKVFEIRMSAEGGQHTTAFRDVGGADIMRWTLLGEEQGGSGGDVQAWRLIAAKYGDTQRIRA
mmetsp:Transcript_10175/g.26078  ORF Transcript_10175/g.26078 Transcript_10175/m.26078 type:complete len:169 (+) Transcript_10175:158-664(+)